MNKPYIDLVRLLIDAAPSVFDDSPFALKGGTAINLFVAEMPRLSVDLDLVFADHRVGRLDALQSITNALSLTRKRLLNRGIESELIASKGGEESKLLIRRGKSIVKIEANHVFRGTVLPLETKTLVRTAQSLFASGLEVVTLSTSELYGSKLVAAMDRQHPRDLFDIHGLFNATGLTPEVVDCFVCYLAGHNRPVHEVLFSRPLDILPAFENEFAGMTRQQVSFDELLAVRTRLETQLPAVLTPANRQFLVSLVQTDPDWDLAPCPYLAEMPAIRWKLENLRKLKRSNSKKFGKQLDELKDKLGV